MGYQQGGPPQGYQPGPQPAGPSQQIDFQALLAKFTTGELVILGASLLWIIFSFFGSWLSASYSCPASFGCSSFSTSDLGATIYHGWGWLAFFAWLAVVAFLVLRKFLSAQVPLPALPVPDPVVFMGLGGVMLLATFLYWVEYHASTSEAGFSASVSFGWTWFIGVILEIAIIVGGYLKQQDPVATTGGGAGGYGGGGYAYPPQQPPQGYAAPPPAYPAQPPYADPTQTQQYPPQQYPPQQYPPQQPGGYPPQPPPGSPPQ